METIFFMSSLESKLKQGREYASVRVSILYMITHKYNIHILRILYYVLYL